MGISDIKLIPLRCPECGIDIESQEDDVVHFCSNCGLGFEVSLDKFRKVDIVFVKPRTKVKTKTLYYLPMWQISTDIYIEKKYDVDITQLPPEILTDERFSQFFVNLFNKEKAKERMTFFVPAFGVTNRYQLMDEPGFKFTIEPPELESDSPKDMVGAQYSLEDAKEIAKTMFLSIQSNTSASIMDADIVFDFGKARIVGIPFYEEEAMLVDAIKGYRIFKDALSEWGKIKAKLGKN
jgi:predicted RNA-binding Zn-ribbon protein involved in translation (DUF1610 family)